FQYGARLLVETKGGALCPQGTMSEDFTIQFWMYPATLGEGEIIFHWENTSADLSGGDPRLARAPAGGSPVYQEISCRISGRVLIWTFTNFFQDSGEGSKTLSLRGAVPLVPRTWRHHALRFDAATGMVEYLVDGEPEAIAHATKTGREDGRVSYPRIAGDSKAPLVIGEGFTGFLDEFSVSRTLRSSGGLTAFSADGGTAQTSLIDLGYGGSSLLRIEAVYRNVGESAVFFYYRLSESPHDMGKTEWQPFTPGTPLSSPTVGRYLLVKAELFPDGQLKNSPRLMNFTVVYERNLPPPPPSFVAAVPGDGKVDLRWSPVASPGLKGYLIYYGSRPGVYDGTESGLGPSPLRVENTTSLSLDGLTNGKLYYFVITTYDDYSELNGQFSKEVNARPSRLYNHD
ncbi:MAG: hypothetical protein FWG35_08435, partial [Spirochaetaceae bacterium]|nr:hypothetical protein [Spirochaetaceae bacterium]